MGTTFSTTQAKNIQKLTPELFKNDLYNYFKKKGFISATESKAEISYNLIFSNKSDWVTLCSSEYEPGAKSINEDAEGIAKALKTHCITASVWDSDFIELELFGATVKQRDSVIIGSPYADDMPTPKGEKEKWTPLLVESATWEQLLEVFNSEDTYVEDSLSELAPLIGIDKENIVLDYNSLTETDKRYVIDLHLKKVQTEGKKAVSLNTAFKQIYGEALEPLGFKKFKGRQPYLVRVLGDEIIHVVACKNEAERKPGCKEFCIVGGVATIYRPHISLDRSPRKNINWLEFVCEFYRKSPSPDFDNNYHLNIRKFSSEEELLFDELNRSLIATEKFMLPIFNKVIDLDSCIEYFHTFKSDIRLNYDIDDLSIKSGRSFYNEGLLYIKTNKYDVFYNRMEKSLLKTKDIKDINELVHKNNIEAWSEQKIFIDNVYADKGLQVKVLAELERRKAENIKTLQSYGLFENK